MLKATCDVGSTTFQEAVVVHRLLTKVDATIFSTPTSFIAEVVTERGAAGGSAIDLAGCASTAASSGLSASDFGSDAAEVFEVGGLLGITGTVPPANIRASGQKGDDDAAAPSLPAFASTPPSYSLGASILDLMEVNATDLSALPSSVVVVR